jgi:hypothetical protein
MVCHRHGRQDNAAIEFGNRNLAVAGKDSADDD